MKDLLIVTMSFLDFMFAPMIVMMLGVGAAWLAARQFQWQVQPALGRMERFLWRNFFFQQMTYILLFAIAVVFFGRETPQMSPMFDQGSGVLWKG